MQCIHCHEDVKRNEIIDNGRHILGCRRCYRSRAVRVIRHRQPIVSTAGYRLPSAS